MAAANALLQRGIDVRVYEQAAALTEVGAGLALQPNGVRMLRRLGFGAEIARWGARWTDPQFRHPDGTLIAPMWPADPGSPDRDLRHAPRRSAPDAGGQTARGSGADRPSVRRFRAGRRPGSRLTSPTAHAWQLMWWSPRTASTRRSSGTWCRRCAAALRVGCVPGRGASRERVLAARGDAQLVGHGQALPGVPRARRSAAELRGFRAHRHADERVVVGTGRSRGARPRICRLGPAGGGDHRPGRHHLLVGPLRPRAAANLDTRTTHAAGGCRPPDAAACGPGCQPGHRGWRRTGDRAEPG